MGRETAERKSGRGAAHSGGVCSGQTDAGKGGSDRPSPTASSPLAIPPATVASNCRIAMQGKALALVASSASLGGSWGYAATSTSSASPSITELRAPQQQQQQRQPARQQLWFP